MKINKAEAIQLLIEYKYVFKRASFDAQYQNGDFIIESHPSMWGSNTMVKIVFSGNELNIHISGTTLEERLGKRHLEYLINYDEQQYIDVKYCSEKGIAVYWDMLEKYMDLPKHIIEAMTLLNEIELHANMSIIYKTKRIEYVQITTTPLELSNGNHFSDYNGVVFWYDYNEDRSQLVPFHVTVDGNVQCYMKHITI